VSDGHTGPGHGNVTLSLSAGTPGGGLHHRSWTICECSALVRRLDVLLPEPQQESWATAEQVRATGEAVLSMPGVIHLLDNGEGT
jgi:hypothetical protein